MAASVELSEAIDKLTKGMALIFNIKFIIICSDIEDCSVN